MTNDQKFQLLMMLLSKGINEPEHIVKIINAMEKALFTASPANLSAEGKAAFRRGEQSNKACIDPVSLKRSLEENRHKLREAMNKSAVKSPKFGIDPFDSEFIVKDFELPSESFRRNLFRTDVIDQRAYPKRRNMVQKAFHSLKHKISVFFRDEISSQN